MAVTKAGFKGQVPPELVEARQHFQPSDQYPGQTASGPEQALLVGMVGADAMNAPASKGLPGSGSKPVGPVSGSEQGPRRAGTAQPVPEGEPDSGGANGTWPAGAAKQPGWQVTGAGHGTKRIFTYGPGGGETGVGGVTK